MQKEPGKQQKEPKEKSNGTEKRALSEINVRVN